MTPASAGFRQGRFSDLPGQERFLESADYRHLRARAMLELRAGEMPGDMRLFLTSLDLSDGKVKEHLADFIEANPSAAGEMVRAAARLLSAGKSARPLLSLSSLAARSWRLRKAFAALYRGKDREAQAAAACGLAPYNRKAAALLQDLLWNMRPQAARLRSLLLAGCAEVYRDK